LRQIDEGSVTSYQDTTYFLQRLSQRREFGPNFWISSAAQVTIYCVYG